MNHCICVMLLTLLSAPVFSQNFSSEDTNSVLEVAFEKSKTGGYNAIVLLNSETGKRVDSLLLVSSSLNIIDSYFKSKDSISIVYEYRGPVNYVETFCDLYVLDHDRNIYSRKSISVYQTYPISRTVPENRGSFLMSKKREVRNISLISHNFISLQIETSAESNVYIDRTYDLSEDIKTRSRSKPSLILD